MKAAFRRASSAPRANCQLWNRRQGSWPSVRRGQTAYLDLAGTMVTTRLALTRARHPLIIRDLQGMGADHWSVPSDS